MSDSPARFVFRDKISPSVAKAEDEMAGKNRTGKSPCRKHNCLAQMAMSTETIREEKKASFVKIKADGVQVIKAKIIIWVSDFKNLRR